LQSTLTKTVLLTGGTHRIGAAIAHTLHRAGMNLALHYRSSGEESAVLRDELNRRRADSVILLQADLRDIASLPALVEQTIARWGRLDALINNASSFYPTPLGRTTEADWDDLLASNLKAPFFLSQAAAPQLRAVEGSIINLVDIYARRPLENHPVYCAAKAGLAMLTRSLAWELGPAVRVNGIAPGAILWPEQEMSEATKAQLLSRIPLRRRGEPEDIASTVLFLLQDACYITGQIIAVDGGRSLSL